MLLSISLMFILALALGWIFNKMRLPSLLGMLLAGIILGQSGFNVLDAKLLNISSELRQIALVIILLRAGLALNISELKKVGRPAILMCFLPAVFEIGATILIAPYILGINLFEAALLGTVIAAVSPAVVVPRMLNLMNKKRGTRKAIPQMIMASSSVDDVFVIVLFSISLILCSTGEFSFGTLLDIPISIILGIALGVIVGLAISWFFKRVHLRDTAKCLIILALSFLLLCLENALKGTIAISALLSIMVMGITILKFYPTLAERISPKFNKMWVGAEIILFVLVGASVDLNFALSEGFAPILLIGVALLFRVIGVIISVSGTKLNAKERLFCALAYLPKATVQAAIGSVPLAMGLPCGALILTVAVLSIILSAPLGAIAIDLSFKKLLHDDSV